jgi:hypothetical protein
MQIYKMRPEWAIYFFSIYSAGLAVRKPIPFTEPQGFTLGWYILTLQAALPICKYFQSQIDF